MAETLPTLAQDKKLAISMMATKEITNRAEFAPVFAWYKEQCAALPEMKISKAPLSDGASWKATHAPNGEVDKIVNPFFSLEGVRVETPAQNWNQAAVTQRSEHLPTREGEKIPVSGVVMMVTSPHGETFVTLTQEPLVQAQYRKPNGELSSRRSQDASEIHPVIRAAIQTSTEKLQKIAANESSGAKFDESLFTMLKTIAKGKNISIMDLLNSVSLTKISTDANRITSHVVYGHIALSDEIAKQISTAIPQGRWCTKREIDALMSQGLTNGHFGIAQSVTEAQRNIQAL